MSYRPFAGRSLRHSAKGSTWEDHKYIKKINGDYYYPDSYEGGRHLDDSNGGGGSSSDEKLSSDDVEKIANDVIRGDYGNGKTRKDALGEFYQQIQNRVNEIYGNKPIESVPDEVKEEGTTAVQQATKKTMNMNIYSAYGKGDNKKK